MLGKISRVAHEWAYLAPSAFISRLDQSILRSIYINNLHEQDEWELESTPNIPPAMPLDDQTLAEAWDSVVSRYLYFALITV